MTTEQQITDIIVSLREWFRHKLVQFRRRSLAEPDISQGWPPLERQLPPPPSPPPPPSGRIKKGMGGW